MQLIFEDNNERTIHETEKIHFSGPPSLFLIAVAARAKNKKQDSNLIDHESLSLQVDGHRYGPSFHGNKLKNLNQTVYILTQLSEQNHTLILAKGAKQKTATVKRVQVFRLNPNEDLTLVSDDTAEDGDRRPWIVCILDNLPLLSFTPTILYSRRKKDSDDGKVKIDGIEQRNLLASVKHFLWRFAGSLLPWTNPTKIDSETFQVNLPQGLHTIEFEADRMPTLQSFSLRLGTVPPIPKRIPTVDDPTWTGDFADDTDEILLARLIFGEAEGVSIEAKIAVGWTVKNRVLAQRKTEWGLDYHEIILKPNQYEAFSREDRLEKMRDPLKKDNESVKKAWRDSYDSAEKTIKGLIPDPTKGATNYYSTPIDHVPPWATEERKTLEVNNLHFYKL
ncbi:cell wall hydrolase [Candidatus Gottesmanbacteria bacterium]|nr:cell wall hydrolase [Candidatus Gottesmanbacteria bacterium]